MDHDRNPPPDPPKPRADDPIDGDPRMRAMLKKLFIEELVETLFPRDPDERGPTLPGAPRPAKA